MKPTPALQIRVGLLIVCALVLLGVTIFLMGRERRFFESKVPFEIHFTRTIGLREGAPVTLTGVRVGSVESLTFPKDIQENYIVVHIAVVGELAARIRKDAMARIRTQGVLGDKYVELSGGSPESGPLPRGGVIASAAPVDYESLVGESGNAIQSFTDAANSLKAILQSVAEGKGLLGQMVAAGHEAQWNETANNLRSATASLKNILRSVERGEGVVGQLVENRETGREVMEDLRVGLHELRTASESLQRTTQKIERGEGTLGTLIQDPRAGQEILASLRRSTANLESVTGQLREGGGILQRLISDKPFADRVLGHLDQTTKDLAQITGKIDRGEGTIGALVNDPQLYQNANELVGDAKGSWLYSIYRFFHNLGSSRRDAPPEGATQGQGTSKQGE